MGKTLVYETFAILEAGEVGTDNSRTHPITPAATILSLAIKRNTKRRNASKPGAHQLLAHSNTPCTWRRHFANVKLTVGGSNLQGCMAAFHS